MKDLKKIDIVFRNCDSIEIQRKDIFNFGADGITEQITLNANSCNIKKAANRVFFTLYWDNVKVLKNDGFNLELKLNLEHKHITSYYLYFNDDSVYQLLVPWSDYEGDEKYPEYTRDNEFERHEKWSYDNKKELLTITHSRDGE